MMPFKRTFIQLLLATSGIVALVSFQNCGAQRPKVENLEYASTGFTHTGLETSCSTCHNVDRPTNTNGFIGLNPNTPFDYDTHAAGMDCIECHKVTNAQRTRADWAGGFFTHSANLVSCESCHSSQRPATYGNNTPHPVSGDCATCHAATMSSTFTSLADWKGGDNGATGVAFDPANNILLSSYVPTFSGTTITSFTTQNLTLNMVMNHSTKSISTANLSNCNLCHANAGSGVYTQAKFHSSLTTSSIAQPTSCNDCHNYALPTGFVGPNDAKRNPLSPAMKHNAVTWSKNAAGTWAATTSKVVLSDCTVCHKNVGSSWASATYHASLIASSIGQPSSCLDCHANTRPTGAVKPAGSPATMTAFNHSIGALGMGDCISCHTSQTTWVGSKFHASVATFSSRCYDCHSGSIDNTKGYDHSSLNFATTDCNACHTLNRTNPTWAGASAAPQSYTIPSHVSSGITVPGYTGVHSTDTNCVSCHGTGDYKKITDFDHKGLPVGQNSCVSCHLGSKTDVAAYIASTSTISMKTMGDRHHPTAKFNGTSLSCVGCHAVTTGANTFTNANVNYPTGAKNAYINVGCGSVNNSTFSCHESGQRTMVIPVTTGTSGRWK